MAQQKAVESDRVSQGDVNLALQTISRDDDLPDEWRDLFDGTAFHGTNEQLRAIRSAMRDYEKDPERPFYEEKSYYDARFALQHLHRR